MAELGLSALPHAFGGRGGELVRPSPVQYPPAMGDEEPRVSSSTLKLLAIPTCLIGAWLVLQFVGDNYRITFGRKRWDLVEARLLEVDRPFLYLLLHSNGRGKEGSSTRVECLDPATGQTLGSLLHSHLLRTLGGTKTLVWFRDVRLGGFKSYREFALSLPDLREVHDLRERLAEHDTLQGLQTIDFNPMTERIRIGEGPKRVLEWDPVTGTLEELDPDTKPVFHSTVSWYERFDREPPPRVVGDELTLEGETLCDNRTGRFMDLGGGDSLVAYQNLEGKTGKLILARLAGDRFLWQRTEAELFGERGFEEPGRTVAWSIQSEGAVILVLEEGSGERDIYVIALDPSDGTVRWQYTID